MADAFRNGSSCSVLDMPPELMEEVASYLPPSDLTSLHITCKEISNKTFNTYSRKCFSNMTVLLYWPRSMQILEAVSLHPRFSKEIKTIRFTFQRILCTLKDWHTRRGEQGLQRKEWAISRQDRIKIREMRKAHQRLLNEEEKFFKSKSWQRSLDRILKNLVGHKFSVQILGRPKEGVPEPCGNKAIGRILGYEEYLIWPPVDYKSQTLAIQTILQAGCTLDAFDLACVSVRSCSRLDSYFLTQPRSTENGNMRTSLRKLNITVVTLPSFRAQGDFDAFASFFVQVSGLTHLRLSADRWIMAENAIDELLATLYVPELQNFEIENVMLSPQHLVRFVAQHEKTLRKLIIYDVPQARPQRFTGKQLIADLAVENLVLQVLPVADKSSDL